VDCHLCWQKNNPSNHAHEMPARLCPRPPRLAWLAGELAMAGWRSLFHRGYMLVRRIEIFKGFTLQVQQAVKQHQDETWAILKETNLKGLELPEM